MLISAKSVDELNQLITQYESLGLYIWGSPVVVPSDFHNQTRFFQQLTNVSPSSGGIDGKSAYQLWVEQAGNEGKTLDDFFDSISGVRMKSEVFWTGVNFVIPETTPTNIIGLLKTVSPTSGSLEPFFKISDDKLYTFNESSTLNFKLNLKGTFTGGTAAARSITLDFVGTSGNTLTLNRSQSITQSTLSFITFISVDKNGNIATNGSTMNIFANGSPFTVNEVLLVAEQIIRN